MLRSPAVAGRFYPAKPELLRRDVDRYIAPAPEPVRALGCVVPHAGYMYSGHVAGAVYGALQLPQLLVILCPNHSGRGRPLALYGSGEWLTPLGRAAVDVEMAALLKRECAQLSEDSEAHAAEHALEVQLPFLQRLVPGFTFVPIAVGVGDFGQLEELGQQLGRTAVLAARPLLIIASSDMNHYEPDAITRAKDRQAIEAILELDPRRLYEVLRRENNTMCGYGPVIAMLTAARQLGANRASLVRYATSADAGAGRDSVVGYAGIVVYREESDRA